MVTPWMRPIHLDVVVQFLRNETTVLSIPNVFGIDYKSAFRRRKVFYDITISRLVGGGFVYKVNHPGTQKQIQNILDIGL